MARPRKARLEGDAPADPVPGGNGQALARIVAYFKAHHPDEWEAVRLCPTQHGVDRMSEVLGD